MHLINRGILAAYSAMSNIHYTYGSSVHILPTLNEDDFIRINVCGMNFETLKATLEKFPSTLLGNEERRQHYYVVSRNAYFFDRNRQCFEAILHFYQSGGTLIRPPHIPMHSFAEEISFFGLGEDVFLNLQANEGYIAEEIDLPNDELQRNIWKLFEYPDSSLAAKFLASFSILIITMSIVVFCIETIPRFHIHRRKVETAKGVNTTRSLDDISNDIEYIQPWFSLELGCITWFTVEFLIRFISSPNKWKFIKSFLNIIDLVAILPYFISMAINTENMATLSVLRVVRLVRVFRIFKLSRHSIGLQILGQTLKESISELGMLVFFLMLGVILFSSAIYYAEHGENDMFTSIPDAFWYSLVTMTTVGYGDKVPKTFLGKIIGSFCAVSGVLTIALPVPVIVSNFEFFYKRDRLNCITRQVKVIRQPILVSSCDTTKTFTDNETTM